MYRSALDSFVTKHNTYYKNKKQRIRCGMRC